MLFTRASATTIARSPGTPATLSTILHSTLHISNTTLRAYKESIPSLEQSSVVTQEAQRKLFDTRLLSSKRIKTIASPCNTQSSALQRVCNSVLCVGQGGHTVLMSRVMRIRKDKRAVVSRGTETQDAGNERMFVQCAYTISPEPSKERQMQ